MKFLRVIAADDHGESVFEAKRLGDLEMEALGVELPDAIVDRTGIALRSFVEDGGQRCARVFDVQIELAGEQRSVDEERAAKVGLSNNGDTGFRFDVLRQEFSKHNLLGEKFGTNRDFGLRRFGTSTNEVYDIKETKEVKESERN